MVMQATSVTPTARVFSVLTYTHTHTHSHEQLKHTFKLREIKQHVKGSTYPHDHAHGSHDHEASWS